MTGLNREDIYNALIGDEDIGFCRNCGEESYMVEPDARNYPCDGCGEKEVFGAQELVIMGEVI